VFRLDFHSVPGWGDDEARLSALHSAVEASALSTPTVVVDPKRNEVVVEFEVEALGLDDATNVGREQLARVLNEAGIDFPSHVRGASGRG
jgi:hypothetical protein